MNIYGSILATSEVFQTALTQVLAHKDRVIHDLQQGLIDIHYRASMNDSANDYQ